jgi:hypothetical protein
LLDLAMGTQRNLADRKLAGESPAKSSSLRTPQHGIIDALASSMHWHHRCTGIIDALEQCPNSKAAPGLEIDLELLDPPRDVGECHGEGDRVGCPGDARRIFTVGVADREADQLPGGRYRAGDLGLGL